MGKLDLDWGLVKEARESAKKIAADSQVFIDAHSTVTVERTICTAKIGRASCRERV